MFSDLGTHHCRHSQGKSQKVTAYKNYSQYTEGRSILFMPYSSFVHRCELGLLHPGSFLRECFRQCSAINHSGRPCKKFQVKLASQESWYFSKLEVALLYGGQMVYGCSLGLGSHTNHPNFMIVPPVNKCFNSSPLSYARLPIWTLLVPRITFHAWGQRGDLSDMILERCQQMPTNLNPWCCLHSTECFVAYWILLEVKY